jgi:hypothetical protein
LFELAGSDYLLTVDYFSNFFEIDLLKNKKGDTVIAKLKAHMSRQGIPDQLMSDNGPPFNSADFRKFADTYEFEHKTSSPGYAQSNGKAENAVKTAKALLRKAKEAQSDPFLALLAWRNTPSENLGTSPAQRLLSRRTKTPLPMVSSLLKPKVVKDVPYKLTRAKAKQQEYYNSSAKELAPLCAGDVVRVKLKDKDRHWTKAKVEGQVDVRSYNIRTEDGRPFRRNRRHLRASKEMYDPHVDQPLPIPMPVVPTTPIEIGSTQETPTIEQATSVAGPETPAQTLKTPIEVTSQSRTTTSSGRRVKTPSYLKDYVQ